MWRLLIALPSRKRETKGVCPALGGGSGGGGHGNRGESLKEEDEGVGIEGFLGGGGAVKRQKARQAEFYLFSILVSLSRSYEEVTFDSKDQFIRKNFPAPNFVKTFGDKIFEKKC